jgi:hypothetical protein
MSGVREGSKALALRIDWRKVAVRASLVMVLLLRGAKAVLTVPVRKATVSGRV